MGELVFLGIASLVLISAFGVVISSSLVYSAVALLFTLFGVAGLYIFFFADIYPDYSRFLQKHILQILVFIFNWLNA